MSVPQILDITDVEGLSLPVHVIAVKVPGVCILRAIGAFLDRDRAISTLTRYVALLDHKIEWTEHSYKVPSYLIYGSGEIPRWGWPKAGVYRFAHTGYDTYRGPAELMEEL